MSHALSATSNLHCVSDLLAISRGQWRDRTADECFRYTHDLHKHDLMTIESVAELVDRLDPNQVEVASARSPLAVATRTTRRLSADDRPGDVVRSVHDGGLWMSIRNIETDPRYAALMEEVLVEFRAKSGATPAEVYGAEGYFFLASTEAVTPSHIDHEHNLFCQVIGTKRFHTGGFPDDDSRDRLFEGMNQGEYGNTEVEPVDTIVHELGPGDGLYVSPRTLHLVENTTAGPTMSFSLVFHDRALDREAKVYAFNAVLRRAGRTPRSPGARPSIDRAKAAAVSGWRSVRQRLDRQA